MKQWLKVTQMGRELLLGLAGLVVVASCATRAITIGTAPEPRLIAQCEARGFLDAAVLARSRVIKHGCIRGRVYFDREFAVVLADSDATTASDSNDWDVVVFPANLTHPARELLSRLSGEEVVVLGEFLPDELCWHPENVSIDEVVECAPGKRPVALRHGKIVPVKPSP